MYLKYLWPQLLSDAELFDVPKQAHNRWFIFITTFTYMASYSQVRWNNIIRVNHHILGIVHFWVWNFITVLFLKASQKLREEGVFKLPLGPTLKRCMTIWHTRTSLQSMGKRMMVRHWNHFSIPTDDFNVLTSSPLI